MIITKKISEDNELYLYMNGKLIYKRWLNQGYSKVFDVMAYGKYTLTSITDLDIKDSKYIINAKVQLKLYSSEKNGRTHGIKSGFRSKHVFTKNEKNHLLDVFIGEIHFDKYEIFELGTEDEVVIKFSLAQRIEQFLEKDKIFWIYENQQLIGEAKLIDFQIPTLE